VLHPWPFWPVQQRTGSQRDCRLSWPPQTSSWIRTADGRTMASSMERYPQLFAESVSTFGSEAIHRAILSQIHRRAYQRHKPVETTFHNLLFNGALFTALNVWRLITKWILLLNCERHEIYKAVVPYKTLCQHTEENIMRIWQGRWLVCRYSC
jgi:hypothetical protein